MPSGTPAARPTFSRPIPATAPQPLGSLGPLGTVEHERQDDVLVAIVDEVLLPLVKGRG
ncbi:hypothetical protein [Paractinoplanes maris]|uniref:hypothetical protein n=1 Tax=Paractinoplanes maris TaxID=1734446 RepID=UPI002021971C|nr:hypothetical protein [Actinoplanes maris]